MVVAALPTLGVAHLQLGTFVFDGRVFYELKSDHISNDSSSSSAACAVDANSQPRDLSYQLYISGCTMSESEDIRDAIQTELNGVPNIILERQTTPDAHFYRNWVRKGSLSMNDSEIRAMFTGRNTLSMTMALTILGATGDATYAFNQMKVIAAHGTFDWENDTIKALLFDDGSTAPHELWATSLDDFTTLDETIAFGYARTAVSGRIVSDGSPMQLLLDQPSLAVGGAAGCIIYQDNGSDALNIPLFMNVFDELGQSPMFNLAGLF